jgi:hypothetical protein
MVKSFYFLTLAYAQVLFSFLGVEPLSSVKGRRLSRLTNAPISLGNFILALAYAWDILFILRDRTPLLSERERLSR